LVHPLFYAAEFSCYEKMGKLPNVCGAANFPFGKLSAGASLMRLIPGLSYFCPFSVFNFDISQSLSVVEYFAVNTP
jgi:hypothetical protein